MQLRDRIMEDRIYWSMESSGMYSVQSAYKILQAQKGLWNATDNSNLWRKL